MDKSSSTAILPIGRLLKAKGLTLDLLDRTVLVPAVKSDGVWCDQQIIELTKTEFKLLQCLMASPDVAHSRNYLLKNVWKLEGPVASNRVEVAVNQLRQRIGANFIVYLRGRGYILGTGCNGAS